MLLLPLAVAGIVKLNDPVAGTLGGHGWAGSGPGGGCVDAQVPRFRGRRTGVTSVIPLLSLAENLEADRDPRVRCGGSQAG